MLEQDQSEEERKIEPYLTMGQLAELMSISKHQIRYNEEKGLLTPALIDTNGYHKYGMDQVYQLANILLLRSLGVSTAQIAQFMTNQDNIWAKETLKETLKATEAKLQQLLSAKEQIENLLPEIKQKDESYLELPERKLSKIYSYPITERLDILAFYKEIKNKQSNHSLFGESFYYLVNARQIDVYIEGTFSTKQRVLQAGDYLVKRVWIETEEELLEAINVFSKEVNSPFFELSEIIVKETAYSSILMNNKLLYELQYFISVKGRVSNDS